MSTEIDCRACGEEVNTRRDHCPACWWRAHKRVPELEEWVRIYKVLRDAHKNHRRQLKADRDEYRNLYHMAEAKITSREAIIEQLSESELAKDVTRLEAENKTLRHTVEDLIVTMKQPAIRGARTTLQMCKFLDVWISDLEDALLTKDE